MAYSIVQPPFTMKFREMPKPELKKYFAWFMASIPERVAGLEAEVRQSAGFEGWSADRSPESLSRLGEWFAEQVETRARTHEEMREASLHRSYFADAADVELTNRTFSIAMDVGMYFGQVVLENLVPSKWDQPVKNEMFADYGQPVIMGFGTVPLNPVRIAVTLAYAIAAREQDGTRLRSLYDIWSKLRR